MFLYHHNDSKLKPNLLPGFNDCRNEEHNMFCETQKNIIEVNNSTLIIRNQLYLKIKFKL